MRLIKAVRNKPRSLLFRQLPTGCWVCVSHQANADGYFRYRLGGRAGVILMFHRLMWEHHYGPIPEGHEINHICHNRGCCNIDHLECIDGTEHTRLSNQERWLAPSGKLMK